MSTTTTLRLTADERAALDDAAGAAGLGPCSYARQAVMQTVGREARVRRKPDALTVALANLIGELGRIGNNLNQLTRKANAGFPVPAAPLAILTLELQRLTAAVLSLRRKGDRPR